MKTGACEECAYWGDGDGAGDGWKVGVGDVAG